MLRNTLLAAVLAVSTLFVLSAASATDFVNGLAQPHLVQGTKFWKFRTRITYGATSENINFGNNYTVVTWGCGTDCQSGVIIDRDTGSIIELPVAAYGYDFRTESNLLVVNPNPEDFFKGSAATELPNWLFREMYTLKNGRFVKVLEDKAGPGTITNEQAFGQHYIVTTHSD
jgi:hypothetical protein